MSNLPQIDEAIEKVEALCGHCAICSPDCPIFVARSALQTYRYDIANYEYSQLADQIDEIASK